MSLELWYDQARTTSSSSLIKLGVEVFGDNFLRFMEAILSSFLKTTAHISKIEVGASLWIKVSIFLPILFLDYIFIIILTYVCCGSFYFHLLLLSSSIDQ